MGVATEWLEALADTVEALTPPSVARPHIRYRHDPDLGEDEAAVDATSDRRFRVDVGNGEMPWTLGDPAPGVRTVRQSVQITMVLVAPGTSRGRWALAKEALEIRDQIARRLSRGDLPWWPTTADASGGVVWACECDGGAIEEIGEAGIWLVRWDPVVTYAPGTGV